MYICLLDDAIRKVVIPSLNRFLANPNYDRFDRDEPPSYVPSPEATPVRIPGEIADHDDHGRKMEALMAPPLNEEERGHVLSQVFSDPDLYCPARVYKRDADLESERLDDSVDHRQHQYIVGRAGKQRMNIIARSYVRKRWQKLGVWNPSWGIPGGPREEPNDFPTNWKWEWQHGEHAAEIGSSISETHPAIRACHLRQHLRFGEPPHLPPSSRLTSQASPGQAESFITSRPWFQFGVERIEHDVRLDRLPLSRFDRTFVPSVSKIWKERGDMRPNSVYLNSEKLSVGWKWRHESPSPPPAPDEGTWKWLPDDHLPTRYDGVLDESNIRLDYNAMELTPSEIDALESVPPPTPPLPFPRPTAAYTDIQGAYMADECPKTTNSGVLNPPCPGDRAAGLPPSQSFQSRTAPPLRRSPRLLAKAANCSPSRGSANAAEILSKRAGRPSKAIGRSQESSGVAKSYTMSKRAQSKKKANLLPAQAAEDLGTQPALEKRQVIPSANVNRGSFFVLPAAFAKSGKPSRRGSGRPAEAIVPSRESSGVAKPLTISKKAQSKKKDSLLSALAAEGFQPQTKSANGKATHATDETYSRFSITPTALTKTIKPSPKRNVGRPKTTKQSLPLPETQLVTPSNNGNNLSPKTTVEGVRAQKRGRGRPKKFDVREHPDPIVMQPKGLPSEAMRDRSRVASNHAISMPPLVKRRQSERLKNLN